MKRHKNRSWLQAGSLALAVVGLAALAGCGESGKAAPDRYSKSSDNGELFSIPQEQMSHVQVVTVQPSTLTRTLRLSGTVAFNNFRTTPVITQVSGPVSRVVVAPGQKVHRGQPMLYVASPDFSQLRTNYLKARDANDLAQKTYNRAKDLYEHHAIAVKDLEQAESAAVQAGGDLSAAEAALKVMGISDPDALAKAPPSFEVPVLAPIAGEVVEQDVSAGQLLQPGNTQCFMISDTSNVWVLVNVYQKDLPYVRTRRSRDHPDRFLSRRFSGPHLVRCGFAGSQAHAPCRRASRPTIPDKNSRRTCTSPPPSRPEPSRTRSPCRMPRFCATPKISLCLRRRFLQTSSADAR